MTLHNDPKYNAPELIEALKRHGLKTDVPSQLSDAFRIGFAAARAAPTQEAEDAALLDFIWKNCLDLRCFDMPTGQGDADIGWRIVQHHTDAPHERVASEVYADDPRKAVREAMVRLAHDPFCRGELHPDAARARQEGGGAC